MHNKILVIIAMVILLLLAFIAPVISTGLGEINKADAAWKTGDFASAAESYSRAVRFLPWRRDLLEKAGIAAGMNNDPGRAIDLLLRAPSLSEPGWVMLGFSYYKSGDVQSAEKTYQSGLKYYDSVALYADLRSIYHDQKDWPAERRALENQLRLGVDDAFTHYRLGLLLSILDPGMALDHFTHAAALDAQFDPALQTMRAALNGLSTDPDRSQQMVTIGRSLGLLQEWDLSLEAFKKAIEFDEKSADAWAWLGEAKQHTGQEGGVELDRALSLQQDSASVRALRGLHWGREGQYPKMLAEYLVAAQLEPLNPAWQASLGDAYVKMGDLASAFDAYQRATVLGPARSTYWRLLAAFCTENGVHVEDAGLPAAQKAVEIAPSDPLVLDVLGESYFSTGRFANAEAVLLRAIKLAPEYLPARIHLAVNYLAQGNRPAAYDLLTYVREADPTGADGLAAGRLLARYFP